MTTTLARPRTASFPTSVVAICGAAVAFDAYDLVAYGATLTNISAHWGLTPARAGMIGSMALVGTLIGSILVGTLAARFPRRTVFLAALGWFSVFTLACAFAPNPATFTALRLIAGLGLGGLIPLAAAITQAAAPPARRNLVYVIMQSGFPLGGVLAALAALVLVPRFGWQSVYLVAGVPLVTLLPLGWVLLPKGEAHASATKAVAGLFQERRARTTVSLWLLVFCAMLVVYGANTWLPALLVGTGNVSSLWFLFAFNGGAIAGGILAGWLVDRFAMRPVVVASFLIGALALVAFTQLADATWLLIAAALAGYGAVGTQTLINSWSTASYPGWLKTTGVGWALGVGRLGAILGPTAVGLVVATSWGSGGAFALFALIAVLGAVVAAQVPRLN